MSKQEQLLEELLQLKDRIERGKTKLAELKGAEANQLQMLNKEYQCKDFDAAEQEVIKLERRIARNDALIQEQMDKLRDDYPVLFTASK